MNSQRKRKAEAGEAGVAITNAKRKAQAEEGSEAKTEA